MCSSAKYVLSFTCVMITLRSSAPSPTITCLSRSCVRGRENLTPASSIAIALASAGPIQIGSTRCPSFSWRITTGVFVVRDRKSTRLNSSHVEISYAVFCLKKKKYIALHLDAILSVDAASVYKPSRLVYQLAVDHLKLLPIRIGFVWSNGWDVFFFF